MIDTAASLCLVKQGLFSPDKLTISREEKVSTAAGIISSNIYKATALLLGVEFDIEFLMAPIDDSLPFNMLIGQNLLKELDAYFFGKRKISCLKIAE